MKKPLLLVSLLVGILLILDQCVKLYIKTHFIPGQYEPLIGNWFALHYTENPGMAFGQTFGSGMWAKLLLSIFRMVAIGFIIYYLLRQVKSKASTEFLMVIGLVLAGATGNLIDSLCYDFFFPLNPCDAFNQMPGTGNKGFCKMGQFQYAVELRHHGFLLGNVVDMFQFSVSWPSWMPILKGQQVFPAIWNVADACISSGVIWAIIRQKKFFAKKEVPILD